MNPNKTALDVTIQAQMLELMEDLTKKVRYGDHLHTHDWRVAESLIGLVVMYLLRSVIRKPAKWKTFFFSANPKICPYTAGLMNSSRASVRL